MDYEQKYKDALRRAQKLYEHGTITESLGWVFPELEVARNDEILQAISVGLADVAEDVGWSDFGGVPIGEIQEWLEKRGNMLDPDKLIEWLKHRELSCDDVVTTVIPDDSPTSVRHKVKWLSDKFIEQFKKDFGLC